MKILSFIGRIIIGVYYIYSGINHFIKFRSMVDYAAFKGVPLTEVAVGGTGLLLILAGASFLSGIFTDFGVAALILFFIPVTTMMHNFWGVPIEQKMAETINFTKNMALMGSALMFLMIKKPWPLSLGKKG